MERNNLSLLDESSGNGFEDIWRWNSTVPHAIEQCVHDVFAEQANARPDAPAICAWDGELTYGKLDALSTRLASHLVNLGVKAEDIVPLCFEKSMWAIVAMIAVLKAGGAFVPVDPGHPTSRHQEIFRQTGSNIALVSAQHSRLWADLEDLKSCRIVSVSESSMSQLPVANPAISSTTPGNAAYVLFTSGSTGVPKGVVVEHSAVTTSCLGHGQVYGMTGRTRVLQFASYTFDACIGDIITPLLHGGCICVPSSSDLYNDLANAITTMDVNWTFLTPSVARLLNPSEVPSIKTLVLGGEQVSSAEFERWPSSVLTINGYGPTECTICCAAYVTEHGCHFESGTIGKSIASVSWVVDPEDHLNLVPLGSVGELLVEGPILARGYLNDAVKTAAAFIEDPVWLLEGYGGFPGRKGRLYKTGDLVRYNADGSMVCLGRKDHQVKLRGQRVELGEIEHHLRQCMPIAHDIIAEVITLVGNRGKASLVAFVCLDEAYYREDTAPFKSLILGLESDLAKRLPSHMVPSLYIPIDHIPMTASGKTDRKQLRALGSSLTATQLAKTQRLHDYSENLPGTEMEQKLQKIWAQVLNMSPEEIGLDDSLFRLGGDSISAMQAVSLCRTDGISLTTQNVMKGKSIKGLAKLAKPALSFVNGVGSLDLGQAGVPFELSPIQQMYVHAFPRREELFDQCFYLRVSKPVSPSVIARALEVVVQQHAMLRARIRQLDDGTWSQTITEDIPSSLRWRHHELSNDNDVGRIIAESRSSLDFGEGPIVSADLFSINESQTFFITVSHLFVDLVSWRIILQDIEQLVQTGSISSLATIPFQSWCQLQGNYARCHLAPKSAFPFPIKPPTISYWGIHDHWKSWSDIAKQEFVLDTETTTSILGECNEAFRTEPVELFIAGLIQSFSNVFQDRDIPTIFNEGHGREPWDDKIDLSRTVGWFTTSAPIPYSAERTVSIKDTIRQTKDGRRSLPQKGWAYFASRFHHPEGIEAFKLQSPMEILLNYQGQYQQFERQDTLFQRCDAPRHQDLDVSLQGARFAVFVVSIAVEENKAQVSFMYNRLANHQDRITHWIQDYESTMQNIVAVTRDARRTYTLSDFPVAFQDYSHLDKFIDEKIPSLGISNIGDVETFYQCSPMQQAILINQIDHPTNYWIRSSFQLVQASGNSMTSVPQIQRAWQAVVQRHAVLRTIFALDVAGAPRPVQIVLRKREAGTKHIKVMHSSNTAELYKEHEDISDVDRHKLQHYLTIYELPHGEVFCVLEINHAIIDGHSFAMIYRDLSLAYSDSLEREAPPPYSEFISFIYGEERTESLEYWKDYLRGVDQCVFPSLSAKVDMTDEVVKANVVFEGTAALRSFCNEHEVTPFTVIQLAWALVLGRFSNTTSTCFGYLSSGRQLPIDQIDEIAGPMINMLTCRVDIQSCLGVLETLQELQMETAESTANQSCSLATVHHALKLDERKLFNTAISYQRYAGTNTLGDNDVIVQRCDEHDPSEYDVVLHVEENEQSFELACGYRTSHLSAFQAESVGKTIGHAILAIIGNPAGKLGDLDLVSKSSLEKLLLRNKDVPAAVGKCVHEVFAEQALERPDAPAICAWDGDLTYGELDELSTRLSAYLTGELGVKLEDVVPLCFEKSMWTVVAMLAVLKAGGAFVPLDPDHPKSRHEEIFRQTDAKVVLASEQYSTLWANSGRITVTVSESSTSQLPVVANAASCTTPENTAYIMFTSGSTGVPKGVVLDHNAVATGCLSHGRVFGITHHSRVLQFASYTFDACIAEIVDTLMYGGCVCVPSSSDRHNNLAKAVTGMDVNLIFLTPSVARLLEPSEVPCLRTLVLAGEQVTAADCDRWGSTVRTINGYGPTECTVCCAAYVANKDFKSGTIGTPVGSVSWVVDPENYHRLVPLGSVGELLVEGPILARGYLNDAKKTAAVFVNDPAWLEGYGGVPGRRRLYKTGDLVCYDSDGNLVCLGRKDDQVKLRGQRVELGEVEHHVRECLPQVKQLAVEVVLPSGKKDGAMLATFVQLEDDTRDVLLLDEAAGNYSTAQVTFLPAIEEELATRLPAHMVPTVFFALLQFPVTTSGKTDRKRLREIGASFSAQQLAELRTRSQGLKRQPTTEAEQAMRYLWAQVLNIEPESIGLDDSFFRLGGDSISAMKLVSAACRTGVQLSVADVFRHPRLGLLASSQTAHAGGRRPAEEIPLFSLLGEDADAGQVCGEVAAMCRIDARLVEDIYPCSPLQEGLMSLTAKRTGDYVMQSVLDLRDDVDTSALRAAWQHVVKSIAALRTRIVQHSELGLLQVVVAEDMQWIETEGLEDYLERDRSVSMKLSDPLVRYALIKESCGPKRWFALTIHHALYDGWSLPRVLQAVHDVYNGATLESQPNFNAFIKYLGQQNSTAAEQYWQTTLADCEAPLFPLKPSTIVQSVADKTVNYQCRPLPKATSDITASTLIRAAWAIIASRYSSSDDVVFGTTVSGRNAPVAGIEAMLSPTIATVPIRVRIRDDQTVAAFLEDLQLQAMDMVAYEQTGLQRIARASPGAQHACDFQTLLIVQPAPARESDGSDQVLGKWRGRSELHAFTTYGLLVQCTLATDGIQITASFDQRVIEDWMVDRMLAQFSFILQQLASAETEATVASIEILAPENRQELLASGGKVPPAIERCIHDVFTEHALAQPSAPAICAWDGELTYNELDRLSSILAGHLIRLGIKPEKIVPLCFEKSMWTIVAMLAVLKAGGAFLLLDPLLPHERLKLMCSKVSATFALASQSSAPVLESLVNDVIIVTRDMILQTTHTQHVTTAKPKDTAYVIFTSGSTGEPKGCKIEHRATCSAVLGHGPFVDMDTSTRTLQFGSYAFAGSLVEILLTLTHGGCVCIPSEAERMTSLASAVSSMNVNWAFLTSTVVDLLIGPNSVPSLKTLCVGGEPIRAAQIAHWAGQVHLRQTYGSSETSGVVSSQRLTSVSTTRDVGKASTGAYWIVDPNNHDRLVPRGAVGELLVEGHVLGREYIDTPEKTAATFINPPAWRVSFGPSTLRLYKTGDLARNKKDGSIELLGRKDGQVKLRGQRIELGEIEHQARLASSDIEDLAVELIRPQNKGESMLACFLVVDDIKDSQVGEDNEHAVPTTRTLDAVRVIQDRLERLLPQYMIPTAFISLPRLPETWSKKIDRKQLRDIGASFSAQQLADMRISQGSRMPSTTAEKTMQQLWAQVLNIEPENIRLDDSFFRLGGDSIAAMKLVSEAGKAGLLRSVADLFRNPKLINFAGLEHSDSKSIPEGIPAFSLLLSNIDPAQVRKEAAASCGVDVNLVEDVYPCSPLQEGLMSLTSKRAGGYIMQNVLELGDNINEGDFKAAWEQVVRSTAALRTRIVQQSKHGLLQAVLAENIKWVQAERLDTYLTQDKAASMTLGEPLARYALVEDKNTHKSWFVWTIHHAVYDGWTLPRIVDAVVKAYRGIQVEEQPGFRAFIKYLGQQDQDAATAYWEAALADCEATVFPSLPTDVQQPVADAKIEHDCSALPEVMSDTTTSTLIRAALAIVISCYTSSDDVVFGTTVTGRNAPIAGIEAMMGPTIATVPVRIRVQGEQMVSNFLDTLQRQATGMMAYEQTGLQRICKIGPGAQNACSFQTLLVVQPAGDGFAGDRALGEWHSSSELQDFSTYGLMLQCTLSAERVHITASFDVRVVEQWIVEKLLGQLSFVMQQLAAADAETKVANIDLLTPADKQQLLRWNSVVPAAVEQCVHEVFAEQAKARPNAPAICAWDGDLTYGELNTLSTRLAGYLVDLGVKPEEIVPLCFEKSMWTVVAMLAVLKAGGAFLLIDPALPHERVRRMCIRTSSTLVLASPACAPVVGELVQSVVVVTKESVLQIPQRASWTVTVQPTDTAYVIFTSGSTGEPKGCKIEHRSACSSVVGHGRHLEMRSNTRTLQFGSYAFAGALVEILGSLVHGSCICIPSDAERTTGLASAISRMNADWAFLTPTVLDFLTPESVPSLSILCIGGEPIRAAQITEWESRVHLRQTYGSSETAGIVSSKRLTRTSKIGHVGKASTGVYWIVDSNDHTKLAPVGAIGEVLIEGHILGREYIDNPGKTAATFIEAPAWRTSFGEAIGRSRLYKIGDLARYKMDGSIELMGRKDNQIKLRGQRIELGEIEQQVRLARADVKEVAVELVNFNGDRDTSLACFIVLDDVNADDQADEHRKDTTRDAYAKSAIRAIQDGLGQFLPQYMVPTLFMPIGELPKTSSRKIDRRRLREIGASLSTQQLVEMRMLSQELKRQPSKDDERTMQQLWAQVLNVDPESIGLDDSFFRLGGDSISAMKLVDEARKKGMRLSVADFFRHPELESLVNHHLRVNRDDVVEPTPPFSLISPAMKDAIFLAIEPFNCSVSMDQVVDILPASYMQEFFITKGVKAPREALNYFHVDLGHSVDIQTLENSCSALLDLYPLLRTHFVCFQEKMWQVVPGHVDVPFHNFIVDKSLAEESFAIEMRDIEQISPFGLPTSFMLVQQASGASRLIIRLSHAQYDGVCLPVILRSLASIYQQEPVDAGLGFPNYQAYAQSRQSLSTDYWRKLLEGSQITNITSKLRSETQKRAVPYKIKVERVISTPQLPVGLTIASLVSSAWAAVLSYISGKEDVVYGLVIAGRNSNLPGIADLVGPCLNIIPVRAQPFLNHTSLDLLKSVQDQYLSLGECDSMGFDQMVQDCTDWPVEATFDTIIQHQNIDDHAEIEFAGETATIEWLDNPYEVPQQLTVLSTPCGDQMTINISGNTHMLTAECAQALLGMLCDTVIQLSSNLQAPVFISKSYLRACKWDEV